MSPLPELTLNATFALSVSQNTLHHLSKRINLNPLHYLTLPIKSNWGQIKPALAKFNHYGGIISVLLAGLGLIAMLDMHKWKLPRWPWAKDGLNNPPPSFIHENEMYTVDELAEKKLLEALMEMKIHEDFGDLGWEESEEKDREGVQEAGEQFIEDTGTRAAEVAEGIGIEEAI